MAEQDRLYLICDCMGWGANCGSLVESTKVHENGRITFYGPFTESNRVNKNNRIYPDEIIRPEFDRLALYAETKRLFGEADHPSDSVIHIKNGVGFAITKLWWDDHKKTVGWGEARTLATSAGQELEAILHEGFPIGISSRGIGTGRMSNEGHLIISEGFRLITFDAVGDPSYQDAWQAIRESVRHKIEKGVVTVAMYNPTPNELKEAFTKQGLKYGGLAGLEQGKSLPIIRTKIEEAQGLPVAGTLESITGIKSPLILPPSFQPNVDGASQAMQSGKANASSLIEAVGLLAVQRIRDNANLNN